MRLAVPFMALLLLGGCASLHEDNDLALLGCSELSQELARSQRALLDAKSDGGRAPAINIGIHAPLGNHGSIGIGLPVRDNDTRRAQLELRISKLTTQLQANRCPA